MSPSDRPGHKPSPSSTTRRRFLTSAAAGTGALLVTGTAPQAASAASFLDHTFSGVAAFVVPGNDRFSRQQRVSISRPGGVAAQAGRVLEETLDSAIPLVVAEAELPAPGALGVALLLESLALNINPLAVVGPFASPFANLSFVQKRTVLQNLDELPLLRESSIEFAANAVITLAAFGAYSEFATFDPRTKSTTSQPLGWAWSQYGGVSDGWPEFTGYYQGRTEVHA